MNEKLKTIQEAFAHDCFATEAAKITIREAKPGEAVCVMPILPKHLNSRGTVMGGAIFTLADFAAAVAANAYADATNTITLHGDITYLAPAKGCELVASAKTIKRGRTTALYEVDIRDELGTFVAFSTLNGYVLY